MPDKTKEEVNAGTDIEPIVALDLTIPNGKRMRDCPAADMKRFGDFLPSSSRSPDRGRRFYHAKPPLSANHAAIEIGRLRRWTHQRPS
jgi:hypothetical protein